MTTSASRQPVPVPDELTQPYWDAARAGKLVLQRCQQCRQYYHPPQVLCDRCVSSTLAFEQVSGRGTIYSYSVMYAQRVQGFEDRVPYNMVVVELAEQPGLTMVTNLVEAENDELRVGAPVELTFEKLTDEITLPQFRLVR